MTAQKPAVRIIQRWSDSQESFRQVAFTHFEGEVHQMGLLAVSPFRITINGLVIPMGGSIELEVIDSEEASK